VITQFVHVVRLTLSQCVKCLKLDITLNGHVYHVSVVYFRAGYVPQHYAGEDEWNARLTMEMSTAIKCPWIGLQLVNTKKIQQVLSGAGIVEQYLPKTGSDSSHLFRCARIRSTFARMWSLAENDPICDPTAETARAEALIHPHKFVMKPQLEGGGSNLYGVNISNALKTMSVQERSTYILMEKITPAITKNYLIRPNTTTQTTLMETVSELGIFGYLLGDVGSGEIMENHVDGYVLRTKPATVDEGGIMAGASCGDSVYCT